VLAVALLVTLAAGPAMADPDAVVLDYGDNGRIDDTHSPSDLRAALAMWRASQSPQYGAFAEAVTEALDARLLGVTPDGGPAVTEQQAAGAVGELPEPPAASPDDSVPGAVIALAGLAGLLLLCGLAAAVHRRLR
jgi:hypothetical protein